MVKLTPELIEGARQYINPLKDRELDLRGEKIHLSAIATFTEFFIFLGYKIPLIEGLGATYVSLVLLVYQFKIYNHFFFGDRISSIQLSSARMT